MMRTLALVAGVFIVCLAAAGSYMGVGILVKSDLPVVAGFSDLSMRYPDYSATNALMSQWEGVKYFVMPEYVAEVVEPEVPIEPPIGEPLTPQEEFAVRNPILDPTSIEVFAAHHPDLVPTDWVNGMFDFDLSAPDWQPTGLMTPQGDHILAWNQRTNTMLLGTVVNGTKGFMVVCDAPVLGLSQTPLADTGIWSFITDHTEYAGAVAAIPANDYTWMNDGQYGVVNGGFTINGSVKHRTSDDLSKLIGLTNGGILSVGNNVPTDSYSLVEATNTLVTGGTPLVAVAEYSLPAEVETVNRVYSALSRSSQQRAALWSSFSPTFESPFFSRATLAADLEFIQADYAEMKNSVLAEIKNQYADAFGGNSALLSQLGFDGTAYTSLKEALTGFVSLDTFTARRGNLASIASGDLVNALVGDVLWADTAGWSREVLGAGLGGDASSLTPEAFEYLSMGYVWQFMSDAIKDMQSVYQQAYTVDAQGAYPQAMCAIGQTSTGRTYLAAFNGSSSARLEGGTGVTDELVAEKFIQYGVTEAAVTTRGNKASFSWKDNSYLRVEGLTEYGVRVYGTFVVR